MKNIQKLLIAVLLFLAIGSKAQIAIQEQLNEIPPMVSDYIDYYFYDLSNYQGDAYQNGLDFSGTVLDKWEFKVGFQIGSAYKQFYNIQPLDYSQNFEVNGGDGYLYNFGPNMFGNSSGGELFFRFIDAYTNAPVYDPFTGEKIGFAIPILEGIGTGATFSPAIMPTVSLGVGYGTEITIGALPGALKSVAGAIPGDFKVDKDLTYQLAIKHDIFNWISFLSDRNYHLAVGVNYSSLNLGLSFGDGSGLFGGNNGQEEYYSIADNLERIDFKSGGYGMELMATKELKWIDFSVFTAYNINSYSIKSEGTLGFNVNTTFKASTDPADFESYVVSDIINVDKSINSLLYGAAIKLHFGRVSLGAKYAHKNGPLIVKGLRGYGSNYLSTTISVAFNGSSYGKK